MARYLIAALYKFVPLTADTALQERLRAVCADNDVAGTLLLAPEGINGTIAGPAAGLHRVLEAIRALPGCAGLEHKQSEADAQPFLRLKVRLKREIVTMGVPGIDPTHTVGTYVEPEDWNDLIRAPDVITIDTRNDYEVRIGRFDGAVNPHTSSFRDFPDWFRRFRETRPNARIAMYCTGGIRCEKATAFVKGLGVDEVFHLRGGILKYLETVDAGASLWRGECFVFDRRVAVGHGLAPGTHAQCHACREPLAPADLDSPLYRDGVSCPYCHAARTEAQRTRYAERQRQERLAAQRGDRHVGRQEDREA